MPSSTLAPVLLLLFALWGASWFVVHSHMGVVVRANAAQKAIGEAALSALGLPESRAFTIDDRTGEVLELVAGSYVPVKEVA